MDNIDKKKRTQPESIEIVIQGLKVTISFAHEEVPGVKGKIVEIVTDSYEKRRLGGKEVS